MCNVSHPYEERGKNGEGSDQFVDSRIPDIESNPLGMPWDKPATDTSSLTVADRARIIIMQLPTPQQRPAVQTHPSYRVLGRRREISFIVSLYLLTRVAYGCKFASLGYRGYDVGRIRSTTGMLVNQRRIWWNTPIKTEGYRVPET